LVDRVDMIRWVRYHLLIVLGLGVAIGVVISTAPFLGSCDNQAWS
jgi:hypothetical protein